MKAMETGIRASLGPLTVGQVAERLGITVRTLHHYDEIGLLVPSGRTSAGYRLYTTEDVVRLPHAVVYRRLGFALDEVSALLEEKQAADRGTLIRDPSPSASCGPVPAE
jgi:DNA-binding transcriptional MerR regulator